MKNRFLPLLSSICVLLLASCVKEPQPIKVTGITLNPTSLSLVEGETADLVATISPKDADNQSVIWSSNDGSIASVNNGRVTAIKAGSTTVTAKSDDGGFTASCVVTVAAKTIEVTSISLSKTELTLTEGDSETITATVKPDDATDKSITWSSDNTSVATVSNSGVVTAEKAGTANITVTTVDGSKTATCAVTVNAVTIPVTSIAFSQSSISLRIDSSIDLNPLVTVLPENATDKSFSFSLLDDYGHPNRTIKLEDGVVTPMFVGTATVMVVSNSNPNVKATCTVTVTKPEAVDLGLSVKWASCNLGASSPEDYGDYFAWGETEPNSYYYWGNYKWCNGSATTLTKYNIGAEYGIVDNKTQLEKSDDAARMNWGDKWRMPTLTESDELRANCIWAWTTRNGIKGFNVTSKINGKSIFLPAAGFRYMEGWTAVGIDNEGYYWSSSLDTDQTGRAGGMYFQEVGGEFGMRLGRFYGISVRPVYGDFVEIVSISLDKSSANLDVGESLTLTATINPNNATEKTIRWSTSNPDIASVSNGVVTAKTVGSATITAYSSNGLSASCTVTVTAPDPRAVDLGLSVKWASCNVGASAPEDLGSVFAWGETSTKSVYSTWNYRFHKRVNDLYHFTITKYNDVDNKIILDPEDDAAHVNWGGKWRTPTKEEFSELINNCIVDLDIYYGYISPNGSMACKGARLTSKVNGNSIFLPIDQNHYYPYWTSTLVPYRNAYSWHVFYRLGLSAYQYGFDHECYRENPGHIRPVSD